MFRKILFFSAVILVGLLAVTAYQKIKLDDGKLHIVFCNVGQGDAIFIRTMRGTDILIDGGPNSKVLSCLSRHMPFWDRTIEVVLLTHPQADHINGIIDVVESYSVMEFLTNPSFNNWDKEAARVLKNLLVKKKVNVKTVGQGDSFRTQDNVYFNVLWPKKDLQSEDPNEMSVVLLLSLGDFDTLLTGDAPLRYASEGQASSSNIDVLKISHHGSKTGTDEESLRKFTPALAVISVGKNNRYGHPSKETLGLLGELGIKILRTDEDGEVEVVSDGKSYWTNLSN